jgi:aminoglycoside-2''-adenylyltransferase
MNVNKLPPGGIEVDDSAWEPWQPRYVSDLLRDVDVRWGVAGGWALDLFGGQQTREHRDLEVAVPSRGFWAIRAALSSYAFEVIGAGRRWPLESPAFEVMHQTWVRERSTGVYRLDVFREPHDGDVWIFRRDASIRLPYRDVIRRTADGIPFVTPEIVLLFKAKVADAQDEDDFRRALPILDPKPRAWLKDALERVHPGHRWVGRL